MANVDFTYRTDEWELSGGMILADIEITLNWSWRNGEPADFTLDFCEGFVNGNSRQFHSLMGGNRAPAWIVEAMKVWIAENQSQLLLIYRNRPELSEDDADDIAWQRQLESTLPSMGVNL